ncbi:MAG: ABC transporter ATP-binding protein [Gammaproteobacteria bacterium]
MPASVLKVDGVSRRFGSVQAVRGVSLHVDANEVVALLGPNGSGKSTLLRLMCGYLQPSTGDIQVGEVSIIKNPQLAKSYLSYVPDESELYGHMRVTQFLVFMAKLKQVRKNEIASRIDAVMEQLSLGKVSRQKINALSRGFRQRVGIAQALLNRPKVIFLDEPSNGLDLMQVQQWRKLMAELAAHSTIIFTSHVFDDVVTLADKVCLMADGEIFSDINIDGDLTRDKLESIFLAKYVARAE